jgi:hypothetical protein
MGNGMSLTRCWRKDNTPEEYMHLDWQGEEEEMRRQQTGQTNI